MSELLDMESELKTLLNGDALTNAADFISFLQDNNFAPKLSKTKDGYSVPFKHGIMVINGEGGNFPHIRPYVIFFNSCNFKGEPDEELKETAWKQMHICDHFISGGKRCGCGKQPGVRKKVFGKDIENCCRSAASVYQLRFCDAGER